MNYAFLTECVGLFFTQQAGVTIELIPEQVVQKHDRRLYPPHDLGKRCLIAFDDADIRAWTPQQVSLTGECAGDATHQIRARSIVSDATPIGVENVGEHARDSGLAVGTSDDYRSVREAARNLVEESRFNAFGDQTWRSRTAAASKSADSRASHFRRRQCGNQARVMRSRLTRSHR